MKAQPSKLAAHGTEVRARVCDCRPCRAAVARIAERQRRYQQRYREAGAANRAKRRAWAVRKWPQELQEGR